MLRSLPFTLLVLIACQSGGPKADRPLAEAPRVGSAAPAIVSVAQPAPAAPSVAPSAAAPGEAARSNFGAPIVGSKKAELAQIIAEPNRFNEQTVLVEGLVKRACSRKGCWMELATSEEGPSCRVTFKDYGFFVPLDAAGSKALVEAVVQLSTLKPKDVRHHEREGAQFPNKHADGSADETRLVASGVELWR